MTFGALNIFKKFFARYLPLIFCHVNWNLHDWYVVRKKDAEYRM